MLENDRTYYLRRAREEEEAARLAACEEARERHRELADAYRLRVRFAGASAHDADHPESDDCGRRAMPAPLPEEQTLRPFA